MGLTHILITRPEPEAGQLAEALRDPAFGARAQPVVAPAFAFSACAPEPPGPLQPGADPPLLIFTSPRAVEHGLEAARGLLGDGARLAAVGPATAEWLERAGHAPRFAPQDGFGSEALLDEIGSPQDARRAVILTAPGGRQALATGLERRGWQVETVHVYRRDELEPQPGAVHALEQAVRVLSPWTSAAAMAVMARRLSPLAWARVQSGTWLVSSDRLADAARRHFARDVQRLEGPSVDQILDGIRRCLGDTSAPDAVQEPGRLG